MKKAVSSHKLDQMDIRILNHLQTHACMTNQELADAVGLSPSPCLQRVKRMENNGVLKKESWTPPESFAFGEAQLKPLRSGEELQWKLL